MVKVRVSPDPEEVSRFVENIFNRYGRRLDDRDSYDKVFNDYLGFSKDSTDNPDLREAAWDVIKEKLSLFEKAGGKSLGQDREKTATKVVGSPKEYVRQGAQKVDLNGLDTKGGGKVGIVKGKTVMAKKYTINIRGVPRSVFRDSKGRFAKVTK